MDDQSCGLISLARLMQEGISRTEVGRRVGRGELLRIDRGIYARPDFVPTEYHDLAIVAARSPQAVVALLSAAAFHSLGTQVPHKVWIALPPRVWPPRIESVSVQVVRFSGTRFATEVQERVIEGVVVRVFSVAKTVVDLFRYRNKIGLDVALEVLNECVRERRASIAELTQIAKRTRSLTPIRPYLESVG